VQQPTNIFWCIKIYDDAYDEWIWLAKNITVTGLHDASQPFIGTVYIFMSLYRKTRELYIQHRNEVIRAHSNAKPDKKMLNIQKVIM
jgi:hypothetical protein